MLHEVLLALSGHQSPLFSGSESELTSQLSSSELALLKQLAHLGDLHQETRKQAGEISKSHVSIICRAVAASITNKQLAAFQSKILDVEQSILSKDSTLVGAYDIVPLSGIATAFTGWNRKLGWLKQACDKMQPSMTGAEMLGWLRSASKTGFHDLEIIILELVQAAESAWLRQLSSWLFYGRLPSTGEKDFMIQAGEIDSDFKLEMHLCPTFVTPITANSIMFVGRSLNHIKELGEFHMRAPVNGDRSFVSEHLRTVSELKCPIASTSFARVVADIRSTLAREALQKLLPITEIFKLLRVLQEFFLLSRGEFSVALVSAADQSLQARHLRTQKMTDAARLGGIMIKDGEVSAILHKTWASLASLQDINDDTVDDILESGREMMKLRITKQRSKPSNAKGKKTHALFGDLLLATPTELTISVTSPMDLFFNVEDAQTYSTINSYLLSIRRAHIHLTELWKLSILRRQFPGSSKVPKASTSKINTAIMYHSGMRSVWAAISSATLLLTELGEFLHGEVVAHSWVAFEHWLLREDDGERDPEILAAAHQAYLANLVKLLMLEDEIFVRVLREFLGRCDNMVAFVSRLETVQQILSAFTEHENASSQAPPNLLNERNEVLENLDVTAQAINKSVKVVLGHLTSMDTELMGSSPRGLKIEDEIISNITTFTPWRGSGSRNLLMRLDFQTSSVG